MKKLISILLVWLVIFGLNFALSYTTSGELIHLILGFFTGFAGFEKSKEILYS